MAYDRISDLTSAGTLTGAELLELSQPTGGTPAFASRKELLSGIAAYIASQGGLATINVTPDTHPASPTAWDDEFEYGTALDTAGARRAGANAWTVYNALSTTNSVANGSILINSSIGAGPGSSGRAPTIYGQPAPSGTAWRFRAKFAMQNTSSACLCGLTALESSTQKFVSWGWLFNPNHAVVAFACAYTNYTTFNADLDSTIGGGDLSYQLIDPITFKTPFRYWEMERNGSNLIVRLSDDGFFFYTYLTIPIATYFTSAPNVIGLCADAVATADAAHVYADWFRRVA